MSPSLQNLQRALREDLNKKIRYEVAYIRNKKSKVIIDRRYNVRSLMNLYMGRDAIADDRISWNPDDPNRLSIQLPGKPKNHVLASVRHLNRPSDSVHACMHRRALPVVSTPA